MVAFQFYRLQTFVCYSLVMFLLFFLGILCFFMAIKNMTCFQSKLMALACEWNPYPPPPPPVHKHFLASVLVTEGPLGRLWHCKDITCCRKAKQTRQKLLKGPFILCYHFFSLFCLALTHFWPSVPSFLIIKSWINAPIDILGSDSKLTQLFEIV